MPFTASAAGKLILCGEHAVVYAHPAIALPVTTLRARAVARPGPAGAGLRIAAHDLGQRWQLAEAAPFPALLRLLLDQLGHAEPDLLVELHSDIPIASGMGSGAAIATALVRVVAAALGTQLTPAQTSALVYESERVFHGTPSGIDNTVIAYEQPIWYQRQPEGPPLIEPVRSAAALELVIGDTGVHSATRAVVGALRQRWLADPQPYEQRFAAIGALVRRTRAALQSGDSVGLGRLLDALQAELAALGVSSAELERLIEAARGAGALGAKLSGAGQGGIMLALAADAAAAQRIALALKAAGAARTFVTRLEAGG